MEKGIVAKDHFQERLGRSASDLLTDIRMTVAANALKTSEMSSGVVAELAGYQSGPPFSARSNSTMGITAAQWRKDARAGKETAPAPSGAYSI